MRRAFELSKRVATAKQVISSQGQVVFFTTPWPREEELVVIVASWSLRHGREQLCVISSNWSRLAQEEGSEAIK
jgi:hypothetical protein